MFFGQQTNRSVESEYGQMRGIIDLRKRREGRAWLENRDTPGINDPQWLRGFELM